MRKTFVILLVLLAAPATHGPAWASELMDRAIREVSAEMIGDLPRNPHVRLVAVTSIRGGDGRIARNLTEALQSDRHYALVERNELEHIIEEQGFQVSDLASRDHRVAPGQIRGVEAIIFGEVLEKSAGPMAARLRVFLQMNNVATGEILMAREFKSTAEAPYRQAVFAFIAVAAILGIFILFYNARARTQGQAKQHAAWDVRRQAAEDLVQTARNLRKIRDHARNSGSSRELSELEPLEFEAGDLRDRIQSGRMGQGTGRDTRKLQSMDKTITAATAEIQDASSRLADQYPHLSPEKVDTLAKDLKKKLGDLSGKIHKRI